jgi:hypothetical protein
MTTQEIMRNCWLIMRTAGRWLADQDELTRAIHQVTVEAVQDSTEATLDLVLFCFELDYPRIWKTYGKGKIERTAAAFLGSEFEPMSILFNVFYAEFNLRYFGGRLAPFRVKVMHNIPLPPNPRDYAISNIDKCERQMSVVYSGWPQAMLGYSLRLMVLIQTKCQRDAFFESELARLSHMGAPTEERLRRLKGSWMGLLVNRSVVCVVGSDDLSASTQVVAPLIGSQSSRECALQACRRLFSESELSHCSLPARSHPRELGSDRIDRRIHPATICA